MNDLTECLNFAKDLARLSGKLIVENANSRLSVEIKSDSSPVTQVDKAINNLVVEKIQKTFPDHGVLGEEADYGSGREEMQWLCDPLDGTKAYILGVHESLFMLGLLSHGEPVLSVVYDPYVCKLFHAIKGQGAFCDGSRIHVNNGSLREGYVTLDNDALDCLPALLDACGQFQQVAATGFKCMILAQGKVIGYVNREPDNHDIGPASLIIEEAGGRVTGLDARPLKFNDKIGTVVASNGVCHDDLLRIAAANNK